MTLELKRQDFTDLEAGSLAFELPDGGRVPLTVLELSELNTTSPRTAPFSVVLEGPSAPAYQQGIVPLLHPVHGRCEVFVVPVARTPQTTQYELTFN